jgi:hypothetical protein
MLEYLRPFYNGAFSIASKHDFDDQFLFFLLATVSILDRGMQIKINLKNVFYTLHLFQVVP